MKQPLTINSLISAAKTFCEHFSQTEHPALYGTTDGKAIGTYVEQNFQQFLSTSFNTEIGNSTSGLDLPAINTDIKVTLRNLPQSSCPYKNSRQKIYGLGYNLLLFVYEKNDIENEQSCHISFVSCIFISQERTGDFQTTSGIHKILQNDGNSDDIFAFLTERMVPGDEATLIQLAEDIIQNPPLIGYLTISNALQWRLQYKRVMSIQEDISGITPIIKLPHS